MHAAVFEMVVIIFLLSPCRISTASSQGLSLIQLALKPCANAAWQYAFTFVFEMAALLITDLLNMLSLLCVCAV